MAEVVYEMTSAIALPDKSSHEIVIQFTPKDTDPEIAVCLPAGAIGNFMVQVAAAHRELALTAKEDAGVFLPMKLSGARPFKSPDGSPILLLQFDGVFELAVELTKTNAQMLSLVLADLHEPSNSAPIKRH